MKGKVKEQTSAADDITQLSECMSANIARVREMALRELTKGPVPMMYQLDFSNDKGKKEKTRCLQIVKGVSQIECVGRRLEVLMFVTDYLYCRRGAMGLDVPPDTVICANPRYTPHILFRTLSSQWIDAFSDACDDPDITPKELKTILKFLSRCQSVLDSGMYQAHTEFALNTMRHHYKVSAQARRVNSAFMSSKSRKRSHTKTSDVTPSATPSKDLSASENASPASSVSWHGRTSHGSSSSREFSLYSPLSSTSDSSMCSLPTPGKRRPSSGSSFSSLPSSPEERRLMACPSGLPEKRARSGKKHHQVGENPVKNISSSNVPKIKTSKNVKPQPLRKTNPSLSPLINPSSADMVDAMERGIPFFFEFSSTGIEPIPVKKRAGEKPPDADAPVTKKLKPARKPTEKTHCTSKDSQDIKIKKEKKPLPLSKIMPSTSKETSPWFVTKETSSRVVEETSSWSVPKYDVTSARCPLPPPKRPRPADTGSVNQTKPLPPHKVLESPCREIKPNPQKGPVTAEQQRKLDTTNPQKGPVTAEQQRKLDTTNPQKGPVTAEQQRKLDITRREIKRELFRQKEALNKKIYGCTSPNHMQPHASYMSGPAYNVPAQQPAAPYHNVWSAPYSEQQPHMSYSNTWSSPPPGDQAGRPAILPRGDHGGRPGILPPRDRGGRPAIPQNSASTSQAVNNHPPSTSQAVNNHPPSTSQAVNNHPPSTSQAVNNHPPSRQTQIAWGRPGSATKVDVTARGEEHKKRKQNRRHKDESNKTKTMKEFFKPM